MKLYFRFSSEIPFSQSFPLNSGLIHPHLKKRMKKLLFVLLAGSLMAVMFTSCAATKRDCQGVRHTRLKNGIYL